MSGPLQVADPASGGPSRTSEPADARIVNAMSVDVEDYFQVVALARAVRRSDWDSLESRVERNTRRLLELFARYDAKATFFFLGWVAERFPDLVREVAAEGHELASHGGDHRQVTSLSPDEFRRDVRESKALIEDVSGHQVIGYRAPSFSIVRRTLWAMDLLAEEGYRYDSSVFPVARPEYGIPDAPRFLWSRQAANGGVLHEVPPSTVEIGRLRLPIAGGAYLRQFPLAYTRWGLRRLHRREGRSAVLCLHPWEIDPDQPRQPVGWLTGVRHYRNLGKTADRLEALLGEFAFTTIRQAFAL